MLVIKILNVFLKFLKDDQYHTYFSLISFWGKRKGSVITSQSPLSIYLRTILDNSRRLNLSHPVLLWCFSFVYFEVRFEDPQLLKEERGPKWLLLTISKVMS